MVSWISTINSASFVPSQSHVCTCICIYSDGYNTISILKNADITCVVFSFHPGLVSTFAVFFLCQGILVRFSTPEALAGGIQLLGQKYRCHAGLLELSMMHPRSRDGFFMFKA